MLQSALSERRFPTGTGLVVELVDRFPTKQPDDVSVLAIAPGLVGLDETCTTDKTKDASVRGRAHHNLQSEPMPSWCADFNFEWQEMRRREAKEGTLEHGPSH